MLEQKFPAQEKTTEEVLSDDVVEEEKLNSRKQRQPNISGKIGSRHYPA